MAEDSSYIEQSELEPNPPDPSTEEGSYSFSISISPEGFTVDGEDVPDLTTLLKHVVAIVKEHPATNDANEQMESGYNAEKRSIQSSTGSQNNAS